MRTTITITAFLTVVALADVTRGQEIDVERYIWQTPRVANIDADAAGPMIEELRSQVQAILDAGPLAPLRLSFADIPHDAYYLYAERGRIITTLAYAYPHVTDAQQEGIRRYVHELLADETHQPWQTGIKGPLDGAVRRLHGQAISEGRFIGVSPSADNVPTLHLVYGLWLYGDRTGDWDAIEPHWRQIRNWYAQSGRAPRLYGQMSAHIAMARLARQFGDTGIENAATAALRNDLQEGLDSETIARRIERTRFNYFYGDRNRSYFPGHTWMYLDISPEIARFLAENVREQTLERIDRMVARYPYWWMRAAPYFTRWTGDEGKGITPEMIGMVFPIERWVRGTEPSQLAMYMRSAPIGIGDCYWLEALVSAIEAQGEVTWEAIE